MSSHDRLKALNNSVMKINAIQSGDVQNRQATLNTIFTRIGLNMDDFINRVSNSTIQNPPEAHAMELLLRLNAVAYQKLFDVRCPSFVDTH